MRKLMQQAKESPEVQKWENQWGAAGLPNIGAGVGVSYAAAPAGSMTYAANTLTGR